MAVLPFDFHPKAGPRNGADTLSPRGPRALCAEGAPHARKLGDHAGCGRRDGRRLHPGTGNADPGPRQRAALRQAHHHRRPGVCRCEGASFARLTRQGSATSGTARPRLRRHSCARTWQRSDSLVAARLDAQSDLGASLGPAIGLRAWLRRSLLFAQLVPRATSRISAPAHALDRASRLPDAPASPQSLGPIARASAAHHGLRADAASDGGLDRSGAGPIVRRRGRRSR